MIRAEKIRTVELLLCLCAFALMAFLLSRCGPFPPPKPPAPDGPDQCVEACANIQNLKCPFAEPTPGADGQLGTEDDGVCLDVCRNAEQSPGTSLQPECVSKAASCEAAEACQQ